MKAKYVRNTTPSIRESYKNEAIIIRIPFVKGKKAQMKQPISEKELRRVSARLHLTIRNLRARQTSPRPSLAW